jgi:glycosyltransferase involved in cell wall biosynthesis
MVTGERVAAGSTTGDALRIALVIGSASYGGGAEKQIALLAEGLHRMAGCTVRLYSYHQENQYWGEWVAARGVPFRAVQSGSRATRIWHLWDEFNRFRPHVVHGYLCTTGFFSAVAGRLARVPVVLYGERNADFGWERWADVAFGWPSAWIADGVVCNSRTAAEEIPRTLHLPRSRYHFVGNGFLAPPEPPADEVARVTAEVDPGNDGQCVLMAGGLSPRKDYPALLEIARHVITAEPRARFLVAGGIVEDPTALDTLRARATAPELRGRVAFLGARRDVPALLRSVQVFLHTGFLEGQSNAVMEASHAGLPVVAVARGGHPDLVEEGVNGFLFRKGDIANAADRILELLGNPALRARLGAAGRERILHEFSVEKLVENHLGLYRRLLAAKGHHQSA